MEDVKIGQQAMGRTGSTTISNASSTPLVAGNASRFAILISPPNGQRVTLNFGAAAVLDAGITLPASSQPLLLSLKDFGAMIQQPIYAIVSGAAPLDVGFAESTLDGIKP